MYVAEAPTLPGCVSQGETREEAVENIKEAIVAYLESLEARDERVPSSALKGGTSDATDKRQYTRRPVSR